MAHTPIFRLQVDNKYTEVSIDELGAFHEHDELTPPVPGEIFHFKAIMGAFDVTVTWLDGENSPEVVVVKIEEAVEPGGGSGSGSGSVGE